MTNYRLFKCNDLSDLTFLAEELTDEIMTPGQPYHLIDDDDNESDWVVSESLYPNPKEILKPNGKVYKPDPIIILRPA